MKSQVHLRRVVTDADWLDAVLRLPLEDLEDLSRQAKAAGIPSSGIEVLADAARAIDEEIAARGAGQRGTA